MAEARQVVGGGKARRPGADHRHGSAARMTLGARPGGAVGERALDVAHVHRAVELASVAHVHAGRRTDAAARAGERRCLQEDRQSLAVVAGGRGPHEAAHVVAGGAGVAAQRPELAGVRLPGSPGARVRAGPGAHPLVQEAQAHMRLLGHRLRDLPGLLRGDDLLERRARRRHVGAAEAGVVQCPLHIGGLHGEHARQGSEQGRVDDGQRLRPQAVGDRDRIGVDRRDPAPGEHAGEGLGRPARIDEDPAALALAHRCRRRRERRVDDDHVVGGGDGAVHVDLAFVDAHESLHRRPGALGPVDAEGLHVKAAPVVCARDQLGKGHAAAAAAAVDDELDHRRNSPPST